MTGLTYPYTKYDRLLGDQLDHDLEFSPGVVPPSGTAGGAGMFKYWVDTTDVLLPVLRQCIVAHATPGAYMPLEWITVGTIDIVNIKFHFDADHVDFVGGSGALVVTSLTVTNDALVGGDLGTNGDLNVGGGATIGGAAGLTVDSGATIQGSVVIGLNLGVDGSLNVQDGATIGGTGGLGVTSGASFGGGITVGGTAIITGLVTMNGSAVIGGNLGVDGSLNVQAGATIGGDASVIGNASVGGSASVVGNTSIGGTLAVAGLATAGSLAVTGAVSVAGGLTVDGSVAFLGGMTAASIGTTGNLTVGGTAAIGGVATVGGLSTTGTIDGVSITVTGPVHADNFDGTVYNLRGLPFATMDVGHTNTRLFDPSGVTNISMLTTQNFYNTDSHTFQNHSSSAVYAIFAAGGTFNATGSWAIISDDSVKENVTPYSAGLAKIKALNPVSYNYITAGTGASLFADIHGTIRYGLMASNVKPVLPEMVFTNTFAGTEDIPDTPLETILPSHLIFVLINAAKELDTRINTGATEAQALDNRVDHLEFGVIDGSEAASGWVGEYAAIPNSAGTAITTGVATSICQITLPAGDWEVWGSADFRPTGNTAPSMIASSISTHPSALPSDTDIMTGIGILNMFTTSALTGGQRQVLMTGQCRAKTTASLTLYMVAQATFTGGGTVLTKGYICARRVR